jgi:hypothetical protein
MAANCALQLVAEPGSAGEPVKLQVQLNPCRRHATLGDIRARLVWKVEVVAEVLALAGTAGEVEALRHDVAPGVQDGLEQLPVARGAGQFTQANEIRQHPLDWRLRFRTGMNQSLP